MIWLGLRPVRDLLGIEGSGDGDAAHWFNAVTTFVLAMPMVWLARRHLDGRPWSGLRLNGFREGWWPFLVGILSWVLPALAGLGLGIALGLGILAAAAPAGELVVALATLALLVLLSRRFRRNSSSAATSSITSTPP